jgi:pimeloyl-ACP methyl ester carboxylesterase
MEPPALPGVTHRFHDLRTGVRAHVAHAGPPDAPAVVLLHGFPQHWWMWRRVIPLLAEDHCVLAMDLRGLGWSGQPADGDFRKRRIAEDAVALLDA